MTAQVIFLTHADVVRDPDVPVPEWGLNDAGQARHAAFAQSDQIAGVKAVFSSTERKAHEGAAPAAARLGLAHQTRADLGENDRSATGYLPEAAFWPVVDAFFAQPDVSTSGWETARDAQTRILAGTKRAVADAPKGDVLIVSHGGVGALLRCALAGRAITRDEGQPHPNGGCWFTFPRSFDTAPTAWSAI